MRYDSSTLPPHLAALFEQIAATEARIAQLDRELAAIRAGRLLDLPRWSVPDVGAARDGEDTIGDASPVTGESAARVGQPGWQRGRRPLRQPGRPAKKQQHSHHRRH